MRILVAGLLVVGACGGKANPAPLASQAPPPGEGSAAPLGDGGGAGACANRPDMFGPFTLDEAQARQRYGANARTFADAPTTKERAIEVCGVPASQQWLRGTACADGSAAKQNGRQGSVGPGGRCGAIIDYYTVTCPERDYDVYIDIYMCGPGESMR